MSLQEMLVNTCDVYRPTVTYTRGVPTKTYPAVATATGLICNLQLAAGLGIGAGSLIPQLHGYEEFELWWAYFEYGADIQTDDKMVDEKGREFIIKTAPADAVGRTHHVEAVAALIT